MDLISCRFMISFYELPILSPKTIYKHQCNAKFANIQTKLPIYFLAMCLRVICLGVTLESSNSYRGVELRQSRSIPRTKQTIHSRRKHMFSISSACRECDIKCDRSQDVGLGRTEECGRHNIAERARGARSWCNAKGHGNIVDRLNVIGGCESYSEGVVGVDCRGCGDACDDGGGRGEKGREEQSCRSG
jgi:hypothetical protein